MWKEAEIWGSKHFDVAWVKVHFKITLLAAFLVSRQDFPSTVWQQIILFLAGTVRETETGTFLLAAVLWIASVLPLLGRVCKPEVAEIHVGKFLANLWCHNCEEI